MEENRRVVVVERPRYLVPTANCFKVESCPVPEPAEGEIRIRTTLLSMDVLLYSRVKRVADGVEPVGLKQPMVGPAAGRIEVSRHPDYKVGDMVSGFWSWQDHVISDGRRLRKLDFGVQKPTYALSAYSASGFGAYLALHKLTEVQAGETVVVGTALGGLGHIAGQIAKLKGCRVVGVTSTEEKCRVGMDSLGFDACVSYKARDLDEKLRSVCGRGVDVYVETVGERVLDAVMPLMNKDSRIAACGLMGMPRIADEPPRGRFQGTMDFLYEVINRRMTVRGVVIFDYLRTYLRDFHADMKTWIDNDQVKPVEDIVVGLEKAPEAFQGIFEGRNIGKRIVQVSD